MRPRRHGPALLCGPSTSPLDAMLSADSIRSRTRRRIAFYLVAVVTLCAAVGAAVWIMPRVLNDLLVRCLVGLALFVPAFVILNLAARSLLSEEEYQRLFTKRDEDV